MHIKSFMNLIDDIINEYNKENKKQITKIFLHSYALTICERFDLEHREVMEAKYNNYKVIGWLINDKNELATIISTNKDIDVSAGADSLANELLKIKIDDPNRTMYQPEATITKGNEKWI